MERNSTRHSAENQQYLIKVSRYRNLKNQIIAKLIAASGWLVLLTLATLLWLLIAQVSPLFSDVEMDHSASYSVALNEKILLINDLDNAEPLITQDVSCRINFYSKDSEFPATQPTSLVLSKIKSSPLLCSDKVSVEQVFGKLFLAKLSQSGILRIEQLSQSRESFVSELVMTLGVFNSLPQMQPNEPPSGFEFTMSKNVMMIAFKFSSGWAVHTIDVRTQLALYEPVWIASANVVLLPRIKKIVFYQESQLLTHDLDSNIVQQESFNANIENVFSFPGQRSLFVIFDNKSMQKRSIVNRQGHLRFVPIYTTELNIIPTSVMFSRSENAAFFIGRQDIELLNHITSEMIKHWQFSSPIEHTQIHNNNIYFAQRNEILSSGLTGLTAVNTWQSVLGENQYEGYSEPDYVWQTTSVSEYSEAKYSLVPLLIGSLKASMLALLIAVPLAISAAIYTAYFASHRLRNWMKPSIETLEAIPSVVLGFVAAIWLVPLAEQFLLTVMLFVLFIPLFLIIFAFIHQPLMNILPVRFKAVGELPVIAILMLINGLLASYLGSSVNPELAEFESSQINGVLTTLSNFNKSTLVVALALGVAIVPSIYSIAEDAIYEVPSGLKQASYALGATRLQTLRKVVLLLAYPGILSAITLGLGRAFGETMIVLMVTGNTPVADWDLLSGIRTLTANLAIELPESDVTSGQYQILFLTALVLFLFTFILNTFAELLRQWLRNNYRYA